MVPFRRHARDWIAYLTCGGLVLTDLARCLKRKGQVTPDKLQGHAEDHPQASKAKFPPGQKYADYSHPTEHEHRTAEQFNWRNANRLNIFIAVAAGGAALFAAGSFIETRRQADAADATLRETRATNIQTDDATKRQLRAYVGITDAYIGAITPVPDGPPLLRPIKFVISEKNFGQTPAYHVYRRGYIRVLPDNDPKIFPIGNYDREKQGQLTVIEPGQSWDAPTILNPTPADRQALMDKTKLIVVYGTVFYEDAFGKSRVSAQPWPKSDFAGQVTCRLAVHKKMLTRSRSSRF
jgi:hypothetical protein